MEQRRLLTIMQDQPQDCGYLCVAEVIRTKTRAELVAKTIDSIGEMEISNENYESAYEDAEKNRVPQSADTFMTDMDLGEYMVIVVKSYKPFECVERDDLDSDDEITLGLLDSHQQSSGSQTTIFPNGKHIAKMNEWLLLESTKKSKKKKRIKPVNEEDYTIKHSDEDNEIVNDVDADYPEDDHHYAYSINPCKEQ